MITAKRLIAVALTGALAAIASGLCLGPGAAARTGARAGAAAGTPTTIDAATDPVQAGQAMSDMCKPNVSNCPFAKTSQAIAYGPNRILGDALYNCGQADAEDSVSVTDERSASTSLTESLSSEVKAGFGVAVTLSLEAEISSGQVDAVFAGTGETNSVSVAPGTIGFTESRVPTATVNGTTSIFDGINLVSTITNFAVDVPGWGHGSINTIDWTSRHEDMTATDRQDRCDNLPALYPAISATGVGGGPPPRNHRVTVCQSGRRRCTKLWLDTGRPRRIPRGTNLSLLRGSVIYASGTVGKRRTILTASHRVRAGRYTLMLSGAHQTTMLQIKVRRRLKPPPTRRTGH